MLDFVVTSYVSCRVVLNSDLYQNMLNCAAHLNVSRRVHPVLNYGQRNYAELRCLLVSGNISVRIRQPHYRKVEICIPLMSAAFIIYVPHPLEPL